MQSLDGVCFRCFRRNGLTLSQLETWRHEGDYTEKAFINVHLAVFILELRERMMKPHMSLTTSGDYKRNVQPRLHRGT